MSRVALQKLEEMLAEHNSSGVLELMLVYVCSRVSGRL
jgi:hypothetical protein